MNKSLVTNLVSVAFIVVGYLIPSESAWAKPIRDIGLYAASGAITNWIAIYMLFEKVPGLYGSGVIPSRFEEFKLGIRTLIMGQFFTKENVENFFQDNRALADVKMDPQPLLAIVDFDAIFERLKGGVDVILEKVDAIVQKRLDELTPIMVKQIIQEMIREHLGWLVVWGGIFGALIGLVASFIA